VGNSKTPISKMLLSQSTAGFGQKAESSYASFKNFIITPIIKRNENKTLLMPYPCRAIALTSIFSKIYECILVNRLEWYINSNALPNPL